MRRALFAALVLAPALAHADGAPVAAQARVSRPEVTVGERFVVDVTVTAPAGTTLTFPPELVTEKAELHTPVPAAQAPAPPPNQHRYEATVFTLDQAEVPAIAVGYRLADGTTGTVTTKPEPVKVTSLLPKDPKEQALADIRPPVALRISPLFFVALGIVGLVVLFLAWRWWRSRRRPVKAAPPVPERSPRDEANAALDRLATSDRLLRGDLRAFYIELTFIAKRYLERRLKAPIVEMTSSEAVTFLQYHAQAGDLAPVLRDLATAADAIKFAKGEGVRAEAERHLHAVRAMVDALETKLQPPPVPAEKAA